MLTAARLAWSMQRWELSVVVGGSFVFGAIMALVAWQTDVTNDRLVACYDIAVGGPLSADCLSLIGWGNLLTAVGAPLPIAATGVPFLVGILLGAPLVAREVEKRTAAIAWALSPSRRRWAIGRVAPVAFALVLALLAVGMASEVLLRTTRDAELGFPDFGAHGPLIAARGLGVFGIGVVVGMLVGRVLPAILITGLVTIALFIGLQLVRNEHMRAEAVWTEVPGDGSFFGMVYDSAWTDDATGALVTYDEAYALYPDVFGPTGSWMPPGMTQAYMVTPVELYPTFVAREVVVLVGLSALLGGAALVLIQRRRPQ